MFDDIDGDRRTTVNAKQSTPNAKQSKYSIYPIFDGINGDRRSTANVKQSRFSVTPTDFNENEEDSKPILQASFYKSIKVDHIQNDDELEDETNKNVTIIQDFIDRNSLTPVIQDVIYNVEDDEFIKYFCICGNSTSVNFVLGVVICVFNQLVIALFLLV